MIMKLARYVIVYSLFAAFPSLVSAADPATVLKGFVAGDLARIAARAEVIAAIRARNLVTGSDGADQIAAADSAWRAELGQTEMPTITPIVSSAASALLQAEVDGSGGLIAEIFLMDAQGLTAAASGATSDFWQGDEAKFTDTFGKGAGAYLIGAVEFDDSTQTHSALVSAVVPDPESGLPISAISSSVNAEFLN